MSAAHCERFLFMNQYRDQRLAETFVALADTLVTDFDIVDFLGMLAERTSELLEIAAAGVILSDQRGGWRSIAASSERAELVELFAVQTHQGPCLDSVHTAAPVTSSDLSEDADRWPDFVDRAWAEGFRSAAAVPLRSRQEVVGSLTLLGTDTGPIAPATLHLAQALADMATIGLQQQHFAHHGNMVIEQLQAALHHRVVLEQAKGVLAESGQLPLHTAYAVLREHAHETDQHLSELARQLVTGDLDAHALLGVSPRLQR